MCMVLGRNKTLELTAEMRGVSRKRGDRRVDGGWSFGDFVGSE